jgi:hypothetical protein
MSARGRPIIAVRTANVKHAIAEEAIARKPFSASPNKLRFELRGWQKQLDTNRPAS